MQIALKVYICQNKTYVIEKTKLTPSLQPKQKPKKNSREHLDWCLQFCLFYKLGSRFEWF